MTFTYKVTASDLQLMNLKNSVTLNSLGYLKQVYNYSEHKEQECYCHNYSWSHSSDNYCETETKGTGKYTINKKTGKKEEITEEVGYCPGHTRYISCFGTYTTGDSDGRDESGYSSCSPYCCSTCYDRIWDYLDYTAQPYTDISIDYVRLLDPYISGYVWFDTNGDGIRNDSNGTSVKIGNVTFNVSEVKVELYSDNGWIASTKPGSDGKYSFGRVRKGIYISGSNGSGDGYTNVPENQHFYYTANSYMSYYIVFNYFRRTIYSDNI
jgi:hypothetical protein